jgi:hypothetical protein
MAPFKWSFNFCASVSLGNVGMFDWIVELTIVEHPPSIFVVLLNNYFDLVRARKLDSSEKLTHFNVWLETHPKNISTDSTPGYSKINSSLFQNNFTFVRELKLSSKLC